MNISKLKVLSSPSGFYVGKPYLNSTGTPSLKYSGVVTWGNDGNPYEMVSEYFPTKIKAEIAMNIQILFDIAWPPEDYEDDYEKDELK
jgi:hypothetical protein